VLEEKLGRKTVDDASAIRSLVSEWPEDRPVTPDEFLDLAAEFYDRVKQQTTSELLHTLTRGEAVIVLKETPPVFVRTDSYMAIRAVKFSQQDKKNDRSNKETQNEAEGSNGTAIGRTSKKQDKQFRNRLSLLIPRLKDIDIFMDDLVIHVGDVDPNTRRKAAYNLIQIPRIKKEICISDQVGEITIVSTKIKGPTFWGYLSKEELKARDDIHAISFADDDVWWSKVKEVLEKDLEPKKRYPKVDIKKFAEAKEPYDLYLVKECMLLHYQNEGKFPSFASGPVR